MANKAIRFTNGMYLDASGVYSNYYGKAFNRMWMLDSVTTGTLSDITIPSSGDIEITNDANIRSLINAKAEAEGHKSIADTFSIISAYPYRWDSATGAWNVIPYSKDRLFIVGTPGTVIKGLGVKIWYA